VVRPLLRPVKQPQPRLWYRRAVAILADTDLDETALAVDEDVDEAALAVDDDVQEAP
jgi:hypothetical protein